MLVMTSSALSITAIVVVLFAVITNAEVYTLEDDYNPRNFFSKFRFFTAPDPTNGFVNYVSESVARKSDLIDTNMDDVYMGVDTTNVYPLSGPGRPSVRITSKAKYNHGLFVLDLAHMPFGCGTWPAYWLLGPNWPNNGEIDIIEGVNRNAENGMVLHTSENCLVSDADMSGLLTTRDCYINANVDRGCKVVSSQANAYGERFNSVGGGIYAMEWTSEHFKIWFFPRGTAPPSLASASSSYDSNPDSNPDPDTFGTPLANFQGPCDIDAKFKDMSIVFDTTFCGDYAGSVYGASGCPMDANIGTGSDSQQSCRAFVANNPTLFSEAYWLINSLRVYQRTNDGDDDGKGFLESIGDRISDFWDWLRGREDGDDDDSDDGFGDGSGLVPIEDRAGAVGNYVVN